MVLVLDDDQSVRESLELLLKAHGYLVRAHKDPEDLFHCGFPNMPSCLLLDHQLGNGVTGVQVHHQMLERGWALPTIFLTAHWNVKSVVNAIHAGADDFIAKPFDPVELMKAVKNALQHSGERYQKSRQVIKARANVATLTPREREIVDMVTAGLLNKEIADKLGIALITVKVHRGRSMKKLGAGNPAELAKIITLANTAS